MIEENWWPRFPGQLEHTVNDVPEEVEVEVEVEVESEGEGEGPPVLDEPFWRLSS